MIEKNNFRQKNKLMGKFIAFLIVLVLSISLSACGCEHQWINASCTEPKTCSLCGKTEGEPLGHSWLEATCTEAKICTVCGETDGTPLGHNVAEYNITKEATCVEEGLKEGYCAFCEQLITERIPATGEHTVEKWIVITEPTCIEFGEHQGTCSICNQTITQAVNMLDHVDDGIFVITKGATELTSGTKATHCVNCNVELRTEAYELSVEERNALKSAKNYISWGNFSRSGLIHQLEFEGYSTEAATNAVDSLNVDWFEQAAKSAEGYMSWGSFSRSSLISQLEFEGFTKEQAEYGVTAVGY